MIEVRTAASPKDVKLYTTDRLREEFLIPQVFVPGKITSVYSHIDRIITGGATPTSKALKMEAGKELRRNISGAPGKGVINIGGEA